MLTGLAEVSVDLMETRGTVTGGRKRLVERYLTPIGVLLTIG